MTFLLVGETGGSGEFAAAARGASGRSDRIGGGFAVIGGDSSDRLIGNGTSLGLEEVGIVFVLAGLPHPPSRHHNRWGEEGGLRFFLLTESEERENREKGR